jgi:hypothetical protein
MNKFTLFIVSGKNPPCRTSTRWIEIVFGIDLAFLVKWHARERSRVIEDARVRRARAARSSAREHEIEPSVRVAHVRTRIYTIRTRARGKNKNMILKNTTPRAYIFKGALSINF